MSPAQPTAEHRSTQRGRRALRRSAAGALAAAFLALAACGDPAPLEGLSDVQQGQLATAWKARISATDSAAIPPDQRGARVTAFYKACEPLDPASPLLVAVKASCQPAAIDAKLASVLPDRCAKPSASCVRALDRIAQNTESLATTTAALSEAATTAIKDPECRAEFTSTSEQLKAYGDLAQAYRVMALGVERADADITSLGQRRIDAAKVLLTPKGRVDERWGRFRSACGIEA